MDGAGVIQLKAVLWEAAFSYWRNHVLFSPKWWLLIIIILVSYAIWWKLAERRRLVQILLFGALICVSRITMDIAGTNAVLWSYEIRETPLTPSPFLHDFTITPLAYMLVYQYSHSWFKFTVLNFAAAALISLVFLPILGVFGYLKLIHWNYFFTFILVFLIAALGRAVVLAALNIETGSAHEPAIKPVVWREEHAGHREEGSRTNALLAAPAYKHCPGESAGRFEELMARHDKLLMEAAQQKETRKRSFWSRLKFW